MGHIAGIYFSNWSIYQSKFWPTDLDFDHLTHVFYAFLKIDTATGKVAFSDSWADLDVPVQDTGVKGCVNYLRGMKSRHPNLKLVFSVGGWGYQADFQKVVAEQWKLDNFVSSAAALVRDYGFDGLDVDWEYPETASEAQQFVKLLKAVKAALHKVVASPVLTVASPASSSKLDILDVSRMDESLSFWNIMAYDFCGSWSSKTGYQSNLRGNNGDTDLSCESAVNSYLARGISPSKLSLGMPMYGRNFKDPKFHDKVGADFDSNISETDATSLYKDIVAASTEKKYNMLVGGASSWDPSTNFFTTYDCISSAQRKAGWIKKNKLAGGFFWEAKGDSKDKSLLKAFVTEVNKSD